MKRYLIIIGLLLSGLFAQTTRVQFVSGQVTIKKDLNQKEWLPVKTNDLVPDKSVVKTGSDSNCDLVLSDGSQVKVYENAMLQVSATAVPDQPKISCFALLGNFFFKIKTNTAVFEVKSPTSLATIQGTEFSLSNTRTSSEIRVKKGTVQFGDHNGANPVIVKEGQKSVAQKDIPPTMPMAMNASELAQLNQWSGESSEGKTTPPATAAPDH